MNNGIIQRFQKFLNNDLLQSIIKRRKIYNGKYIGIFIPRPRQDLQLQLI